MSNTNEYQVPEPVKNDEVAMWASEEDLLIYSHFYDKGLASADHGLEEMQGLKDQVNSLNYYMLHVVAEKETLQNWKDQALEVLKSWNAVSDWITENNKASLGEQYSVKTLDALRDQHAEIDKLKKEIYFLENEKDGLIQENKRLREQISINKHGGIPE